MIHIDKKKSPAWGFVVSYLEIFSGVRVYFGKSIH